MSVLVYPVAYPWEVVIAKTWQILFELLQIDVSLVTSWVGSLAKLVTRAHVTREC